MNKIVSPQTDKVYSFNFQSHAFTNYAVPGDPSTAYTSHIHQVMVYDDTNTPVGVEYVENIEDIEAVTNVVLNSIAWSETSDEVLDKIFG